MDFRPRRESAKGEPAVMLGIEINVLSRKGIIG